MDDSPSLTAGDKSSRADNFTLYLMYKPTGGIWVTLQKVNWWWYYKGSNQFGLWTWGDKGNSTTPQMHVVSASDLPEWDNYKDAIQEQEIAGV